MHTEARNCDCITLPCDYFFKAFHRLDSNPLCFRCTVANHATKR